MYWKCAVLFLILCQECSQKRVKRILNGDVFNGRPRVYSVIQYHGGLGTLHRIPWWMLRYWEALENKAFFGYGEIICSGVLLAPMIFQTACHCLATFDYSSTKFLKPARIKNHFENAAVVYVGLSKQYGHGDTMMDFWPITTERFAIHSKCAGIGKRGVWELATHDYGLIRLDTSWLSQDWKYKILQIQYAPQYTEEAIKEFHVYALQKQLVCLQIGFGNFKRDNDLGSDLLRHGWAVMVPYSHCILLTARIQWKTFTAKQINAFVNWVCTSQFPKHNQMTARGDSGSPLTCDNKYFGILSSGIEMNPPLSIGGQSYQNMSVFGALAHNIFATAINYRSDLIHLLYLNLTSYTK